MSSIVPLTVAHKDALDAHNQAFASRVPSVACATTSAALLIIFSVIVIACASLCLTLPGVNAMQQVILPGILPGACGVLLSIPLFAHSIVVRISMNKSRKAAMEVVQEVLSDPTYNLEDLEEDDLAAFFQHQLLSKERHRYFRSKLLGDIKALYPKKGARTEFQKNLIEALDTAKGNLFKD